MALVRILTILLTLLCSVACKDAVVITPDPIRGYGASVTVKLGDSSPTSVWILPYSALACGWFVRRALPEIRELDYVGGEQTFVLAVDENVFENANAIQARLYVEAFVGDVTKSEAVGSRSITLTSGEDIETSLTLISAPAPVNNQTVKLEYLTNGTWRENDSQRGRLAAITFKSAPPEGFSYHLWRLIGEGNDIKNVRHMGVLNTEVDRVNLFNATDLSIDEAGPFYQLDNLAFAISSESPEDSGYLDKPLGWVLWVNEGPAANATALMNTLFTHSADLADSLATTVQHGGFSTNGASIAMVQSHGEHAYHCIVGPNHPLGLAQQDFDNDGDQEVRCGETGFYNFLTPLVDEFGGIEDLDLVFEDALAIQTSFSSCINGLENLANIDAHNASLAGRARNAILDFQAASAALGQADDATGQIVTEALIALYGGPYSEDAEPSSLGYDCINQSIERLSLTPFQPL